MQSYTFGLGDRRFRNIVRFLHHGFDEILLGHTHTHTHTQNERERLPFTCVDTIWVAKKETFISFVFCCFHFKPN